MKHTSYNYNMASCLVFKNEAEDKIDNLKNKTKYFKVTLKTQQRCINIIIIIITIFLLGLGRLTRSGIDALPSFPGASTISSSSGFAVEGVLRESGVVHSFKVVPPPNELPGHLHHLPPWIRSFDLFRH